MKWAGGKYRIVDRIKRLLPPGQRLIEPFVGSGAVFLNTDYEAYVLSDVNPDLIRLYQVLQEAGDAFVEYCRGWFTPDNNTPKRYYELREEFNETDDAWRKSALFLYLNRHGYNGLCRYNGKGAFNVPFGRYRNPYFPEQEMRLFARKARRAVIVCQDFRDVMRAAQAGDVVYCDPPYVPLTATANFTDYAVGGFGQLEQAELARLARELGWRGIPVLISNHETPYTNDVYQGAHIERFGVRRFISCDGANRGVANELLALFTAHPAPDE